MIQTERDHLERDPSSKALLNKDKALYQQRQAARKREERIDRIDRDMTELKNELCEIKELLKLIIHRN
jgi:hypothetical protein